MNSLSPKTYEAAKDAATRRAARRLARLEGKPRYGVSKPSRKPLGFSGRKGKRLKSKIDRKLVAWSKAVRERDDDTCQRCRVQRKGLEAHHVAPRSQRPDLKYELSNAKTVCRGCHTWIHSHPIEAQAAGLLDMTSYELANKERQAA